MGRKVNLDRESMLALPLGVYSFEASCPHVQPPLSNKVQNVKVDLNHRNTPLAVHFDFQFARVLFTSSPRSATDIYDERGVSLGFGDGTNEMIVPFGKRTYYFVNRADKRTNKISREFLTVGPHKIESDFTRPKDYVVEPIGLVLIWVPHLELYVGRNEVTQLEYRTIMANNPGAVPHHDNLPVNSVTYSQAIEFCKQLQTKAPPPEGFVYTLPTEQQWKAFVGNALVDPVLAVINAATPAPVRSKVANQYGLYDVRGNVAEWTLDTSPVGSSYLSPRLWSPQDALNFHVKLRDREQADKQVGFRVILAPRTPNAR